MILCFRLEAQFSDRQQLSGLNMSDQHFVSHVDNKRLGLYHFPEDQLPY